MNHLDEAERAAEAHRTSFAIALEELDRRRKLASNLPYLLRHHLPAVLGAVGLLTLGVGSAVLLSRLRRHPGPVRRRKAMGRALLRAYQHPERLARSSLPRTFSARLAARLLVSVAGSLASQLARRTARGLLGPG